jgi:hypothetical protein
MQARPMKVIILLFCLFFPFGLCFAQNIESKKDTLYLLFNENGTSMKKKFFYDGDLPHHAFFLNLNIAYDPILFCYEVKVEQSKCDKAIEEDLIYQQKPQQVFIPMEKLQKITLKNFDWLKDKVKAYNWYERVSQYYDPIYIVEVDSISKQAMLTRVDETEVIE